MNVYISGADKMRIRTTGIRGRDIGRTCYRQFEVVSIDCGGMLSGQSSNAQCA